MLFAQLTPTRDSTSELLDAPRHREVAVFGHSTPGQTRTPNERNGTPKRNIFFGRIADRGAEGAAQHQQHFTNPFSSASALTAKRANSPYSQNSTLHKPLQLRVTLRYFTRWKA